MIVNQIDLEDSKVCLNEKLVKHRFVYFEEWIETHDKPDEDSFDKVPSEYSRNKILNACYFGKFVIYKRFLLYFFKNEYKINNILISAISKSKFST